MFITRRIFDFKKDILTVKGLNWPWAWPRLGSVFGHYFSRSVHSCHIFICLFSLIKPYTAWPERFFCVEVTELSTISVVLLSEVFPNSINAMRLASACITLWFRMPYLIMICEYIFMVSMTCS